MKQPKCILTSCILILITLAIVCHIPTQVIADSSSLQRAKILFIEGNWLQAAQLAKKDASAEGLAFSSQITSYYGRFVAQKKDKQLFFAHAMELAEEAVRINPNNSFAHLQYAHAMGRFSQSVGILKAISEGYADRILESTKKAITLDPNSAKAYMLLGNWHAEIINSAGFMGRIIYGADETEALASYEKAIGLDPNNFLLLFEHAGGLIKLDKEEYSDLAQKQLRKILNNKPKSVLEKIIKERAEKTLSELLSQN